MSRSRRTREILSKVQYEGRKLLLEPEAKAICAEYGIPVTESRIAKTSVEAAEFADEIGYPIVLKVVSPDVIHKSDFHAVVLNLEKSTDVKKAFDQIIENVKERKPDARILGVIVQKMAPSATEVIVGAVKDPQFGPVIMFGLGGIFVEIMKDVSFRIAPITEREAKEMITEIKAYPLLEGYRGLPAADTEAVTQILTKTSELIMDHPEIKELDLNPVIVYEKGAMTVDARIAIE